MRDLRAEEEKARKEIYDCASKVFELCAGGSVLIFRNRDNKLVILDSTQPFTDALDFTFDD